MQILIPLHIFYKQKTQYSFNCVEIGQIYFGGKKGNTNINLTKFNALLFAEKLKTHKLKFKIHSFYTKKLTIKARLCTIKLSKLNEQNLNYRLLQNHPLIYSSWFLLKINSSKFFLLISYCIKVQNTNSSK